VCSSILPITELRVRDVPLSLFKPVTLYLSGGVADLCRSVAPGILGMPTGPFLYADQLIGTLRNKSASKCALYAPCMR